MSDGVPAILPLSLLEAVQNIDTPPDDGLGALEHELAAKRFGLSATVAAQVARYRERADAGDDVDAEEALAVFRLVSRRPDAALVYADAGRRAARFAARRRGAGSRALSMATPGRVARVLDLRRAGTLSRRWLVADLRDADGHPRCEITDSLTARVGDNGNACVFYTAALAELLRLVAGMEGAVTHHSCRGQGERSCIWLAAPTDGLE